MADRFEMVPFNDHRILTVRDDRGIHIVMKPIVERLGLQWEAQLRRMKGHPAISEGMSLKDIPSAGGVQSATALALEQFPGWLVTIEPRRLADEGIRETIIRYQREAFRAIFEHFHGPMGAERADRRGIDQMEFTDRAMRRRDLPGLMDRLEREQVSEKRRVLHALIVRACEAENIDPPAIDTIGAARPSQEHISRRFFEGIERLALNGVDLNHARLDGVLAYNLREVAARFKEADIPVMIDTAMHAALRQSPHPLFLGMKPVNSRLEHRTKSCWVFSTVWRGDGVRPEMKGAAVP